MQVLRADWPVTNRVGAMMTSRLGGRSESPFDSNNLRIYVGDEAAEKNRRALRTSLNLPGEPLWLQQVHGTECVSADTAGETQADAAWTDQPGRVIAIQTADCLPVLFADRDGRAVAAAHAGWRGLCDGVLESTLASLPVPANDVHCWLGVSIGACCFEVGAEVRAAFVARHRDHADAFQPGDGDKWMADLYQLARLSLQRAGVAGVWGGVGCTACEVDRYFSYRRDKGATGRMASLIWLDD